MNYYSLFTEPAETTKTAQSSFTCTLLKVYANIWDDNKKVLRASLAT